MGNLSQSHDSLAHSAELLQTAEQVGDSIDGDNGIHRQIYQCQKLLGNLQNIEPRFAERPEYVGSIEAELGEISANMRDVAGRSDIDPNELAAQESRMGELMSMARKYRIEPEELPQKAGRNRRTTAKPARGCRFGSLGKYSCTQSCRIP